MTDLDDFLQAAEREGSGTPEQVLARVLHLDSVAVDHVRAIVPGVSAEIVRLMEKLDFEVKVRNPGVHYVCRSTYLGYRREGATAARAGARSQVFLSVVPKTRLLKLVFVPPPGLTLPEFAEPLDERGHHGVGTTQCSLRSDEDLERFVHQFATLLTDRRAP